MTTPVVYPYIAGSIERPDSAWLGFPTQEQGCAHAGNMNKHRDTYGTGALWNIETWPRKPAVWMCKPNPAYILVAVEAVGKEIA